MALLLCSGRDAASLARMLADQSLTPLMATLAVVVVECVPDPASASHGGRVRSNASRRTAVVRRNSSAHVWRPGCCGGKVVDTAGFDPVEVPAGGDVVAPGPLMWIRVEPDAWRRERLTGSADVRMVLRVR